MLEHGIDIRPLKQRGYRPTEECERAVESVLSGKNNLSEEITESTKKHKFRLISTPLEGLDDGELSNFKNALLPIVAAIGGICLPALIHFALNARATISEFFRMG